MAISEIPPRQPYPSGERLAIVAIFMACGCDFTAALSRSEVLFDKYADMKMDSDAIRAVFWNDLKTAVRNASP